MVPWVPQVHAPNGISIDSAVSTGLAVVPNRPTSYNVNSNRPYLVLCTTMRPNKYRRNTHAEICWCVPQSVGWVAAGGCRRSSAFVPTWRQSAASRSSSVARSWTRPAALCRRTPGCLHIQTVVISFSYCLLYTSDAADE